MNGDLSNSLPSALTFDPEMGLAGALRAKVGNWSAQQNEAFAQAGLSLLVPSAGGIIPLGKLATEASLEELKLELAAGSVYSFPRHRLAEMVHSESDPNLMRRYLAELESEQKRVGLHITHEEVAEYSQTLTLRMVGTSPAAQEVGNALPIHAQLREVTLVQPDGSLVKRSLEETLQHGESYSLVLPAPMTGDTRAILRYEFYQGTHYLGRKELVRRIRTQPRPALKKVQIRVRTLAAAAYGERCDTIFVSLMVGGSIVLSQPFANSGLGQNPPAEDVYIGTAVLSPGKALELRGLVQAYLPGGSPDGPTASNWCDRQVTYFEVEHLHPGETHSFVLYVGRASTSVAFAEANLAIEVTAYDVSDAILRSSEMRSHLI
jgi:hypothetical protein